jgi:hypothetical protein
MAYGWHCESEAPNTPAKVIFTRSHDAPYKARHVCERPRDGARAVSRELDEKRGFFSIQSDEKQGDEKDGHQHTERGEIHHPGAIVEPGRLPFGRVESLIFNE